MLITDRTTQPPATSTKTRSLKSLLHGWVNDVVDLEVNGLQVDNRKVKQGDIFIAMPGQKADGRDYIEQAISNGAIGVLYESEQAQVKRIRADNAVLYAVENLREKLGYIASRYYDHPSKALNVIGVTGTNGKTTVAYLLCQAMQHLRKNSAYLGTIGKGQIGALNESSHTTVDAIALQNTLADFKQSGMQNVCMEVSSHGLDQARVNGVDFDVAIYTNLSRDHLDYHHTMRHYAVAKKKLFEFPGLKSAVINTADAFGEELYQFIQVKDDINLISYGVFSSDLVAEDVLFSVSGMEICLRYRDKKYDVKSTLLGDVNVLNILAVIGCLLCFDYTMEEIVAVVHQLSAAPGRMEVFAGQYNQPAVVVDYAHTPDALERVLLSLKTMVQGRLICVFGCGGDRDSGKRTMMGKIAETYADQVILTDDNPRFEHPANIVKQIAAGMQHVPLIVHDRKQALNEAIQQSGSNDVILLAGKGHESTQIIGNTVLKISDREMVSQLLKVSR